MHNSVMIAIIKTATINSTRIKGEREGEKKEFKNSITDLSNAILKDVRIARERYMQDTVCVMTGLLFLSRVKNIDEH